MVGLVSSMVVGSRFGKPLFFLGPLLLLTVMGLALYALFKQKPFRVFLELTRLNRINLIQKIADKLLLSISCYGADRVLLYRVMILSFFFQFSVYFIVFLLSRAIHSDLPFIYFCTFVPLITLLEVLPISINGIGLRDAGYVFFFGSVGMSDIQTRSLALLFLGVSVSYSMIGGMVYLVRNLFEPSDK
jgi:glycosyltransferase 2 family protein